MLSIGKLSKAAWKQQVALLIGVIAGSAVVPPVLELLNRANGFAGAPNPHAISSEPLAAPQATLISTLASGVIGGKLPWHLVLWGAALGLALVAFNFALKKACHNRYSLPPLGVGLAIYLPSAVTGPVVLGAVVGFLFERATRNKRWGEIAKRLGVLVMSGFIVGESLFNVALAGLIVLTGKGEPLKVSNALGEHVKMLIAIGVGILVVWAFYGWSIKNAKIVAS